jgi:hypothetical protein
VSTKWIGVNTVDVETITSGGVTVTKSAPFAVVTATAASGDVAVGDISFITSPEGKSQLASLFEEVAAACAGTTVKRSGTCELDYLSQPGVGGGVLEFDLDIGILIPMFTAGDVAVALQSVPAAVAVAFIAYVVGDGSVPDAVKIPEKDQVKTNNPTTTSTSTEDIDLAPYVTTNLEWAMPTDAFDTDEAYAAATYMQALLLSLFPTNTDVSELSI